MDEEYWLKYGFKENGELVCLKTISNSKPDKRFFYTENGSHKEVLDPKVILLTKENLELIKDN